MRFLVILLLAASPTLADESAYFVEPKTSFEVEYKQVYPSLYSYRENLKNFAKNSEADFKNYYSYPLFTESTTPPSSLGQVSASFTSSITDVIRAIVKISYESGELATVTQRGTSPDGSFSYNSTDSITSTLISVGSSFRLTADDKAQLNFKVFGGWFFSDLASNGRSTLIYYPSSPDLYITRQGSVTSSASVPFFEVGAEGKAFMTENIFGSVSANYRTAHIASFKSKSSHDIDGDNSNDVFAGDPYKDVNGNALAFDLSGFSFSLSLGRSF